MDIESLRVFRAVAQRQSVSRAARALGCVPSNVTARVRGLEEELGVQLFTRRPRGMLLTAPGEALLVYAERAQALLREAREAVSGSGGPEGPLRIGATESVAANRLPDVLIRFARQCPEVDLSLRVGNSRELTDLLLENEVDAALMSLRPPDGGLACVEVFTEELVLVSAANTGKLTPEVCASVVLQRSGCAFREALERFLALKGFAVRRRLELPAPEVALACVEAGMGVAVMAVSALERLGARGRVAVHELPAELRVAPVSFVRSRRTTASRALETFLALCLESGGGRPFPIRADCGSPVP